MTLAVVLLFPARAADPRAASPSENELLFLRNGQVIEGQIARSGDWYYVLLSDGEIRLKASDVELTCRNLGEGYKLKRARLPLDSVEEHLRLAQWCQHQGLLEEMTAELAEARRIDPKNPMVELVQRRLEATTEPQKPVAPAAPAQVSPKPEELDRMVRSLPAGTVEKFTQTIQPILMNNCTTGGCHNANSNSQFHLLRIANTSPPNRRTTQQNIYETLQWVKRDQPEASPLLTVPLQPHGNGKTAVFRDTQTVQYKRLTDWVMEVAGYQKADVPAVADSRSKPKKQASSEKPTAGKTESITQPTSAADPYDPEAFNRRNPERAN
jgi:hypothetical protein